jgi:antirestriction protein ArdC
MACQRIRDNISNLAAIDATTGDICVHAGVRAFYDCIHNKIYVCEGTFSLNADEFERILIHEYFHATGLVHGSENPIINIDSCFYSITTESKLDNPYCMTGLVTHIAYGHVWWQS